MSKVDPNVQQAILEAMAGPMRKSKDVPKEEGRKPDLKQWADEPDLKPTKKTAKPQPKKL